MDDWCGDHCTIVLKEYKKDLDKWSLFHRWEYFFFVLEMKSIIPSLI